ncbi:hypothetical protein [Aliihoeflea sp. 40Bstr573]|uniref:hypothetical protein n=1 Tax=Aliihoeflea sp. 40Bstr573 TaxID=2696467 RepID=UPI002095D3B8|nr:hypothetical protein [Aliihoeflea sp. 40Bstr573]MCO6389394.1 hypothetical protein [Aliihoeflea sp. 40Bstr573]
MYIGAANLAASQVGDVVIQANLNALMYNGLADYNGAKKAFQTDLGEEPTAELTVSQLHTLSYRASRRNLTHVSFFPFEFGGIINQNWASVKGTVKILDEKIAYPVNHVVIECTRSTNTCDYRQIALTIPDENSWVQSYHVGNIADEIYEITRWENDQIDAVPLDAHRCRINQLNLNFATDEYFEIVRNNTAGDCETALGVALPRLERPRLSQIVDGRDIVNAEFQRLDDEAYGYLSSDFRRKVHTSKETNSDE